MSAVGEVSGRGWCQRNQKSVGYSMVFVGVAAAAIAIGVIVGACLAPTANLDHDRAFNAWKSEYGFDREFVERLYDVNDMPAGVISSVAVGGLFLSLFLITGGIMTVKGAPQEAEKERETLVDSVEPEKIASDARKKYLKIAAIIAAFIVGTFALGLMAISATMLDQYAPNLKQLIEDGRQLYPGDNNFAFFDKLQSTIDVTVPRMTAIASIATIAVAASGGIFVFLGGLELAKKMIQRFRPSDPHHGASANKNV